MKKLISITALISALLFTNCHKAADPGTGNKAKLVGKWMLIETLADPGDGTGRWTPVDKSGYYLKFNQDNTIETNTYTGLGQLAKYNVLTDSSINFIYNGGQTILMLYDIKGTTLTIRGGCIEPCGSRFIR